MRFEWRAPFDNADVNALHAEGFDHAVLDIDWRNQVERHSLGWVCAFEADRLIGFVNVAWDGGAHAFVIDTLVAPGDRRHSGSAAGCSRWPNGRAGPPAANGCTSTSRKSCAEFYVGVCGFAPTPAGLIALR